MWYTMVAEVTVFPVPGGPWIKLSGLDSTLLTAWIWYWFRAGKLGAEYLAGRLAFRRCSWTSWPKILW